MKCVKKSCQKEFNLGENVIVKKNEKMFKCPYCGTVHIRTGTTLDLIRGKSGQLTRRNKKVKMSKKQRLKLRSELKRINK